jgi:hypothetical protein
MGSDKDKVCIVGAPEIFWQPSATVFHPSFDGISAICSPILMQNNVLEWSLVVDYMAEIWI